MPRETKAQRIYREAQEKKELKLSRQAEYPTMLMDLLERALKVDFVMTVSEGKFMLVNQAEPRERVSLPYEYSQDSYLELRRLETHVCYAECVRAEEQRVLKLRTDALNKLTLEERELLGLL